uniref:Large ribosomal subunit protein uL4c n=1 Tax=Chroomonas placoidea TaxID=173977 RepID=A0A222AIA7_9CRYP|nr:ribosomal protein L4 [Chroomonas placoidea]ASO76110.1 ribosomal protein L4 [Chroomonas placoidea]
MALLETINYKVKTVNEGTDTSAERSVSLKLNIIKNNSKYLIHRAVVNQDNQSRQGTSSTKTRSEVRAGGKKPWKQKGTGQARSGSKNSPLWNGGGVAFGPKPRSYRKKINSKEWKLALQTALFNSSTKITVIANFIEGIDTPNTKKVLQRLENVIDLNSRTLLVLKEPNVNVTLSLRNVTKLDILYSNTLNVKDILLAKNIIIVEDALENIQKTYHD